jgi:hypothetical protein
MARSCVASYWERRYSMKGRSAASGGHARCTYAASAAASAARASRSGASSDSSSCRVSAQGVKISTATQPSRALTPEPLMRHPATAGKSGSSMQLPVHYTHVQVSYGRHLGGGGLVQGHVLALLCGQHAHWHHEPALGRLPQVPHHLHSESRGALAPSTLATLCFPAFCDHTAYTTWHSNTIGDQCYLMACSCAGRQKPADGSVCALRSYPPSGKALRGRAGGTCTPGRC